LDLGSYSGAQITYCGDQRNGGYKVWCIDYLVFMGYQARNIKLYAAQTGFACLRFTHEGIAAAGIFERIMNESG
jgi:hypothetical protein